MRRLTAACLLAALALAGPGCSWFRDKPATPAEADIANAPIADANPTNPTDAAPTPAADPIQAPATVALDFLQMHQRFGNSGLPQRQDLTAYDAFLCPSLGEAIRAAQVRQELARAEHPDDKPPLVEGDLFSSLFEGPDRFQVSETTVEGNLARVVVSMTRGEGEGSTRWKDTLVLQVDDGIWCLADVEYGGDWPFANKGRLGTVLAP